MTSQEPIARLVKALENPEGPRSLDGLRRRLGPPGQKLDNDRLGSKGKTFRVYAAEAPGEQGKSIVVKFNPLGTKDDVYKDFRILTKLKPLNIAPEPLFRSSRAEERVVGAAFIAMSMIEGQMYRTVQEIPQDKVIDVYLMIMRKLAEVHREQLGDKELPVKHHDTKSFWQEVVDEAKIDYNSTVSWWQWWKSWIWDDPERNVFSHISSGGKPSSRQRIGVVHGNLDIGNFVFNPELTEVHAILNWKYEQNGDGLIDVASLLLVFLDIGSYGVSVPQHFVYSATDHQVGTLVNEYSQHARNGFTKEDLEFAKAVCYLKLICVVKRGVGDDFEGHELGHFPEITANSDIVINLLRRHAEQSYKLFSP